MALQNYIIVKKYYNFFTSFNNLFAFFHFPHSSKSAWKERRLLSKIFTKERKDNKGGCPI